jgi:hypothetical protein
MADYSVEICKTLEQKVRQASLHRPMRISRYDDGTELVYDVTSIEHARQAKVRLLVEKFVGGGFAGQVYKVRITNIEPVAGPIESLRIGGVYAMKILIPPSGFSALFRNTLYWLGFQGPFQLQVNPAAARAGALWQKFIRRAAKIRFGNENTVVDIHATFIDSSLASCGELSEWVDGRTWRLEVDEHMDLLKRWRKGKTINSQQPGSPEYRAKKEFMADFVKLLHDAGGHEFARQYEWSTCKSQPNCLKRNGTENDPYIGLVAVDFRAGLALLPFLPMSPGDFKLIYQGLKRGSLVQFDRGDISKLQAFVEANSQAFTDMKQTLEDLKACEQVYRNSVPDITHNHVRLLYSKKLWSTMLDSAVTGWKVRNLVDDRHETKLRNSKVATLLFFIIGIIPAIGKIFRRIWARPDWRKHYSQMLTSFDYLKRAVHARIAEKIIDWYRAGRINQAGALKAAESFSKFLFHLPFSVLPAGLHRFLTDKQFRKDKLAFIFVRPFKLYFNRQLREQWLRDMVAQGQKKNILTEEDSKVILSQINEPYIQKYLISLVVHCLTLPVTHIVATAVAVIYLINHWGQPNAWAIGLGIVAFFQIIPISPGSICRGVYVVYLVIKEKDFKNYNIAVFIGFFKYIGYLAFPMQMAYRYPALARFMASHWATEAVHIVPVFGERGALLEHQVFCLFYNWPLTIRRRMNAHAQIRAQIKPRYWHVGLYAILGAAVFAFADLVYLRKTGTLPAGMVIWWLWLLIPVVCGTLVTLGCRGAVLWKRMAAAGVCGAVIAVLYTTVSSMLMEEFAVFAVAMMFLWRVFIFTVFSTIAAFVTELKLPDKRLGI